MRDLTIEKTTGAQRHDKPRDQKGIPPLLICWLIAVGFMILVSSNDKSLQKPSADSAPAPVSQQPLPNERMPL